MNVQDRLNAIENGWKPQVFKTVLDNGNIEYRNNKGELHSENDQASFISFDEKTKAWYKNGLPHRDNDKPAIIRYNGLEEYWENGVRIR